MRSVRNKLSSGKVQPAATAEEARERYDRMRRGWKLSRGLRAVTETADEIITANVQLDEVLQQRVAGLVEMAAAVVPEIEELLAVEAERAGEALV